MSDEKFKSGSAKPDRDAESELLAALIRKPPRVREIASEVRATHFRRGLNSLRQWIGFEDRTWLLNRYLDQVRAIDAMLNIDDIRVQTLDHHNECSIDLMIRRRSRDFEENDQKLSQVVECMTKWFSEPHRGKRFAPARRIRMAVEAPDLPGTLQVQTEAISNHDLNIRQLSGESREGRCLLMYDLVSPSPDESILKSLESRFTDLWPNSRTRFDEEAFALQTHFQTAL